MLGHVEVKPSSLQIPIRTVSLTKNPLIWSQDNVIILTTQLNLCILELECSDQSSCIDLQFRRYALDAPEAMNPFIPCGAEYLKSIRNDGTKMTNQLSLPQLTSTCRRAGAALGAERMSNKPSQISGQLCHNGYRKTLASHIKMSKNYGCFFCTVTYDHQLWIITKVNDSYKIIHNLSAIWNQYIKSNPQFPDDVQASKCRKVLAEYIRLQCFYDFFWTPSYKEDTGHYSFLVTMTGSNHVVAFKIPSETNMNQEIYVQDSSELGFSNVTATYFYPGEAYEGILVLASSDGRISLYKINFHDKDFLKYLGAVEQVCRAPITNVCLDRVKENNYLLLVVRSCVLMAYIIKIENNSVIDTASSHESGRFCITGIQALNNHIVYATLSTGMVVKYNFNISSDFCCIKIEKEELFKSEQVSFNGFAHSPNKCLWAIFETLSVPYDHLHVSNANSIHVFGVNKPETLYNFALNGNEIPIERKADVIENIRLYAARRLFNSLVILLIGETVNVNSVEYLQNYLALCRICINTISKENLEKEFVKLNSLMESVEERIVKYSLSKRSTASLPSNDYDHSSVSTEIYPLINNNEEVASDSSRCMLCGRKQSKDDSATEFCKICFWMIQEPMSEETFMPYCSFCEVKYSPTFCSELKDKNCIYCNRILISMSDIPMVCTRSVMV